MKRVIISIGIISILGIGSIVDAACVTQQNGELTGILTWQSTDTTDPINILRSTVPGGEVKVTQVPAGSLSYTDTVPPITSNITYYWEVQTINGGGVGTSNEVCKSFFPKPTPPSNLAVQ